VVVGEDVVADAVTAWSPLQPDVPAGQVVERIFQVHDVAHLEGDVEQPVLLDAAHQVDGVMIGVTAQEREEVSDGVGPPEAEHVGIEALRTLEVFHVRRDMAELGRPDAERGRHPAGLLALVEVDRRRRFRFRERKGGADLGLRVGAQLGVEAQLLEVALDIGERSGHLEADCGAAVTLTRLDDHAVMVDTGGEVRRGSGPLGDHEAKRVLVVIHEPFRIGGADLVEPGLGDGRRGAVIRACRHTPTPRG